MSTVESLERLAGIACQNVNAHEMRVMGNKEIASYADWRNQVELKAGTTSCKIYSPDLTGVPLW